jgi:pimeloyl-ACP methyl ester carboxylesterase
MAAVIMTQLMQKARQRVSLTIGAATCRKGHRPVRPIAPGPHPSTLQPAADSPPVSTPPTLFALTRLSSGAVVHADGPVPPTGIPVLFLHGVGGAAWSWAPQVQALRGQFECLVWEARGHGASAKVHDAGLADYAEDAREALEAVWAARQTPVLLVAHSMGAMLALALACEQPRRVRGLFLVDPVVADSGTRPAALKPLLALLCWLVSPVVRSYQRDGWLSRAISRRFFRWAFLDAGAMAQAWELQRKAVPLEYPRMLYESIAGVAGFSFRPFADLVTAPTFILEARQRPQARSRFDGVVARFRARAGVRCEHEVLEGGHYLQLDRPRQVSGRLLAFAESLRGRAPGH